MNPLLTPRRRAASDDNLIPLINIVFLLLIFFMVAGQMQRPMAADIRLPDIDSQQPAQGDIQLELTADGGLWLNQQATHQCTASATCWPPIPPPAAFCCTPTSTPPLPCSTRS